LNLDHVYVETTEENAALESADGNRHLAARGSYNTLDFAVRLRSDLHHALKAQGGQLSMRTCDSWEVAQAFSTYLHETIHWWQHVGTSTGLMLSFLQPAHAHINRSSLKQILATHGPVKPLLKLAEELLDQDRQDGALNRVLNNWHDLEFFRRLVFNPEKLVESVSMDPYFDSVGHSYCMAICATSSLISATIDPNFEVLPPPLSWESEMEALRESKVQGFYKGSDIDIPPLGLLEILEGQARFSQLQYLYGGSGGNLTWAEFHSRGLLSGLYIRAFEIFLALAGEEMPEAADDPVVGLFLLICDVALSPSEGLFLPMTKPSSLIWSTDPGLRFMKLCQLAEKEGSEFKHSIKNYSAQEYWDVSQRLSDLLHTPSPKQLAETVSRFADTHPAWTELMEEDRSFNYRQGNFPIRVLLGRFTRMQRDKLAAPQFFCWPGMCLTSFRQALDEDSAIALFTEHEALFIDRADRNVYPRLRPGKDESTLQFLLDQFFQWVSIYEMTHQWLIQDGPFNYDYGRLTNKFSREQMKEWADRGFTNGMGVHPDEFSVLR
jgi:hypothetical protein